MRYQWQEVDSGQEFTIRYQLTDSQTGQALCVFDQPTNGIEAPIVPQDSDDKQTAGIYCQATEPAAAPASGGGSGGLLLLAAAAGAFLFFGRKK